MTVAEPAGCVVTVNELLVAVPVEHEYEIASVMPTSATWGWQESCAVGMPPLVGTHCQLVMQIPLYCARHEPVVQFAGSGCCGCA